MNSVRSFLGSPITRLVIALVAFAAALSGEWNTIISDMASMQFSGHHGVMLMALWHTLDATTQLLSTAGNVVGPPN